MEDGKYSIGSDLERRRTEAESTTGVPHHYGLTFVDGRDVVGYMADFSQRRPDKHVIFYSEEITLHIPENAIRVLGNDDITIKPNL
ncbi:MAG: hypothetical protein AABX14_00275 [Candidatus Aenigmatarchaeota archaeon]